MGSKRNDEENNHNQNVNETKLKRWDENKKKKKKIYSKFDRKQSTIQDPIL